MWILVLITCATAFDCSYKETKEQYITLSECEAAMQKLYKKIEPGQGLICYGKDPKIVKT